jgi:hypothetical protein
MVTLQWDDDEVRFVLDQHTELDFIVLVHWSNSPRIDRKIAEFGVKQHSLTHSLTIVDSSRGRVKPSTI